jgi:glucose-fructose oxidoreductase
VFGEDGHLRLSNAFGVDTPMTLTRVKEGRAEDEHFEAINQFAATAAHFADCILRDVTPEPSGYEGLQDVRIVEAIYRSSRDGRPVTLPRMARIDAGEQETTRHAVEKRQAS